MTYSITTTLGPASSTPQTWEALLAAGASAFRLNTSHLSLPDLAGWLERLNAFFAARPAPTPLVLDLQGSKWRLGAFPAFDLLKGAQVTLLYAEHAAAPGTLPVPHADFFHAAPFSSHELVLNDAKIRLQVEGVEGDRLLARVTLGGRITQRKGITFTESEFRGEALSEKDQAIAAQAKELPYARFALSYVKDAEELRRCHAFIDPARLIAKLERAPALESAAGIAAQAGELWLCRGDLGAELGLPEMAAAVHRFSAGVRALHAPVILAGQVLEHMTAEASPTRSEVCCLYDSLQAGYQGFVLSDETAVGRYPVESCRAAAMFRQEKYAG